LKSSSSDSINYQKLFEAEIFKELIINDLLLHVLDTAARVKIGSEIYQITELGTFVYNSNDYEKFKILRETFIENYVNYSSKIDSVTYHYGNIKFIDTYGHIRDKR
jgi:hypothetical protein